MIAPAAVALLALVPPPVSIFYSPDFPERTTITMRDDRPITRCTFKGCPAIGYWPEGGTCPAHTGATGARVATPELIAEIDGRYDR